LRDEFRRNANVGDDRGRHARMMTAFLGLREPLLHPGTQKRGYEKCRGSAVRPPKDIEFRRAADLCARKVLEEIGIHKGDLTKVRTEA